jgi:hypothetical protein
MAVVLRGRPEPGRDMDITNDDSENVPPMVVCGLCAYLSNTSDIPFLSSKMPDITLIYATDILPKDLKDVNAPG